MKKTLLYLANIRLPTEKAHGIQIMKMCEAFSGAGEEVVLVVPNRYNNISEDPFSYYSVKKNFKIVYLPTLDLIFAGRVGFWIQQLSFSLASTIYALFKRPKLIYSRDEWPLLLLSFFTRDFVWEVHVNRYNFIIRRVLAKSRVVVTITSGLANFFEVKQPKAKYVVASDGIDLSLFSGLTENNEVLKSELQLPKQRKIIAYIGKYKTMSQDKGVLSLIRTFSGVKKAIPETFLLLVGINKDELVNIQTLFKEYGILSEEGKIITHLPHKEAMKFLAAADVTVMNYPQIGHFTHFMSPLKLFEYMASGRPIVTSDLPSIREILNEDCATFFSPGDDEALAQAIVKVLNNYTHAQELAAKAKQLVKNYTWEARANKIIDGLKQ